ncbi:MAG: Uma2 family endonuclease, partial [Epsilonproteobacteria bacterium]
MSNLAYQEYYTKDDYAHWEGDWEIVDGVAYAM